MLALDGIQMGLEVHILSEKNTDPAALVTKHWHQGNPNVEKDQLDFCKKIEFLTFESEFHLMTGLQKLAPAQSPQIFPSPQVMEKFQHRFSQKKLLSETKIPTAKFLHIQTQVDIESAFDQMNGHFVLKKTLGGYDGYGTYYCHSQNELLDLKKILQENPTHDFIAEEFIKIKRELAMIFVRSADGSFLHLPLVETKQTQSRCDWVMGPAHHPQIKSLISKMKKLLNKENYIGALGVELFDTGKGLLVNELAPRVHNSGHYSQDALSASQFSLHLMAGLGKKLISPQQLAKVFVMVNLLGQENQSITFPQNLMGTLHWYGKTENRKGRKLGHVNYLGTDRKQLLKRALSERKGFTL